jgi:tRNA(adenine34) deaminase
MRDWAGAGRCKLTPSLEQHMRIALEEARASLREGNQGFGAVIVHDSQVIATAHDMEETQSDPTAHAEMAAIRRASVLLGKDLSSCTLVSTHEPCPLCATAIVWARIAHVGFGFGIDDAIEQGLTRMAIPCEKIFDKANARVAVERGVLKDECATLYRQDVRAEVARIRAASDDQLRAYDAARAKRRVDWFQTQEIKRSGDPLATAYWVLLRKLGASPEAVPVIRRESDSLTFHSKNFCPTLAACEILGLDTRDVCRLYNSKSPDALVKEVDPRLSFSRNYKKIRPHSEYCEETIKLPRQPSTGPASPSLRRSPHARVRRRLEPQDPPRA